MKNALLKATETKSAVRNGALKKRDAMSASSRRDKSLRIRDKVLNLSEFRGARRVLFFASYKSEVSTDVIIKDAAALGKDVVLPKVDAKSGRLTKHLIKSTADTAPGFKGIPEPTSKHTIKVEDVDIIFTPGAAFDTTGRRIGYGGGYYDKLLHRVKGAKPIIALAFEEQIYDEIPADMHDIKMDIIITDTRVIRCHG